MRKSRNMIATPPGATIREQLEDRGMSQKVFALRMGMSEKHISQLINGEVRLTPDTAERLEMVLGVPASFWNKLEAIYQEKLAKVKIENEMDEDKEFSKNLPYYEMAKNKWVPEAKTPEEKVVNLRKFFEVTKLSLIENPTVLNIACRRLNASEKSDFALLAWAQEARREARNIETEPIDLKKLGESLPLIREMTLQEPEIFCRKLQRLMASCGIALIYLPHIGGSFLHGATFQEGNKIVMGLTVRGKDADRFWFSLFHEIGHVIKGHIAKLSEVNEEDEKEADTFARDSLISQEDFDAFTDKGYFDIASISQFAAKIGIAPGIVVGRLQKENFIPDNRCNSLKIKYQIP